MDGWAILLDLVITLAAAALFGLFFERFRQSATIGYILGGVIVGPGMLGLVREREAVEAIAEFGVVLLMFSIGLEFSLQRLLRLGPAALWGGAAQVLLTMLVGGGLALAFRLPWPTAIAIGAVVALSSTAIVLRVLRDVSERDSKHGKNALGILLMQDVAVVPLVILLTALGGREGDRESAGGGFLGPVLVVALMGLLLLVPRLFRLPEIGRNRELPVLLAVIGVTAAAWAAHSIGLNPSVGAFIAGMIFAESAFSEQIHADVAPLRTLFLTIFFASIGMLADVRWILENLALVFALAVALIFGKTVVVFVAMRLFRQPPIASLATGFCLAHIGEFSFLLGSVALAGGLMSPELFQLFTSASVLTLVATPYLVTRSPVLARSVAKRLSRARALAKEERSPGDTRKLHDHIVIVGFGDAGQAAYEQLQHQGTVVVMELDPELANLARARGAIARIGDASQNTILEHLSLEHARVFVCAVPDFHVARVIVRQVRSFAPELPIVARARYHRVAEDLLAVGADAVIDEEKLMGYQLGEQALECHRHEATVVPPAEP